MFDAKRGEFSFEGFPNWDQQIPKVWKIYRFSLGLVSRCSNNFLSFDSLDVKVKSFL